MFALRYWLASACTSVCACVHTRVSPKGLRLHMRAEMAPVGQRCQPVADHGDVILRMSERRRPGVVNFANIHRPDTMALPTIVPNPSR